LCWDELETILNRRKFKPRSLSSQESFLVNHAGTKIQEIFSKTNGNSSGPRMQALKEIIHPVHLGSKFQALWGIRG
jgi:SAM-dependent MidA family methyltransferase